MNILALGTSCVDVYPQKNTITPGGEALNIAVHLSFRDDVQVFLMGLIGDDAYAGAILRHVRRFKMNARHLYQVKGETAHHVIHIDQSGDRYFEDGAWHGGVSADFRLNDQDRRLLSEVDGVIVTLWEPNLKELLRLKSQTPCIIAVDFNVQRDFAAWEALIPDIDIFFISAEKSMKPLFQERSKVCETIFALTFGEHGSAAYHKGQAFECPAVKVEHVVDTTGCGDCYQGHFLAEYLKTRNIQASMERAALEAAKVTAYVGGFPNF